MRIMQRILTGIGTAALAFSMTIGGALPVHAAETSQSGTLTIRPEFNSSEVPISSYSGTFDGKYDGTFRIYKVADYDLSGEFTKTSAFEDYDGEVSDETLSVNSSSNAGNNDRAFRELTEGLTAYLDENSGSIKADESGVKAGAAQSLDYGLYLVTQDRAGTGYKAITPFLTMLPVYGDHSTSSSEVVYAKLALGSRSDITSGDPPIIKQVNGNPSSAGTFTFEIAALTNGAPMPVKNGAVNYRLQITTASRDEADFAEFGDITFELPGQYLYKVSEVAGDLDGYTYDTTVYYLRYDVTVDAQAGLSVKRTITRNGEDGEAAENLLFTNTFSASSDGGDDDGDDDRRGGGGGDGGSTSGGGGTSELSEDGAAGDDGVLDLEESGSLIDDVLELIESGAFTGDESNMVLYGIVAAAAAGLLAMWIVRHRKARAS